VIHNAKPDISRKELRAVKEVLRSGNLAQGVKVKLFEERFSKLVEGRDCVAVNSGTSGLLLALIASGIGIGDEVIVPSFTFAATANSVVLAGAKPVFVDIDLGTFNINPQAVEAAITSKTRAIQPVHLYGLPANMYELRRIAKKYGLLILEDAAQAHLASIEEKPVGTFGDLATFSFYPTKNMTAGEGGMIVCNSPDSARICRLLRNQGMERRYENEIVGFNMRMTEINAAIGIVQLEKLRKWSEKRKTNAQFFSDNLKGVITPSIPDGYSHVFHQYTIRIVNSDRDKFANALNQMGISTGIYYPRPVHKLESFKLNFDLDNTEIACEQVLSLPVHPKLSRRDLESIVEAVNHVANAGS
jgi:perosamine synthetase